MSYNLKFELHTHTIHSDGSFTPKELVECAIKYGYNGIAITDHNTDSGADECVKWGNELGLTVIKGIEWTTFWGHIVVLGGKSSIDWRSVTPQNVIEKVKEAKRAGDIVGIAHPYRVGYPVCTGGRNQFPQELFEYLDFYEVVSGELEDPTNLRSAQEYYELKQNGYNLTGTYGRDWHRDNDRLGATYLATYLYSEKPTITAEEALEAIKQGKVYVGDRSTGEFILR